STTEASSATATSLARSARVGALSGTVLAVATLIGMALAYLSVRAIGRHLSGASESLTRTTEVVRERAAVLVNASQSLAEGSSEQAASLEESSASLEEMAQMTRSNTDSARDAENVANQTRTAADH